MTYLRGLTVGLAMAVCLPLATTSAQAEVVAVSGASGSEATVRLTGELMRIEHPGPEVATDTAIRVDGRLVPVDSDAVSDVAPGTVVTLDVTVPDAVRGAAESGDPLTVTAPDGSRETHDVDTNDLAAATRSPAADDSTLGEATTAVAVAPDAEPLAVEGVVSTTTAAATSATARRLYLVTVAPADPGVSMPTYSTATLEAMAKGAGDFWRTASGGKVSPSLAYRSASAYRSRYTCADPYGLWNEAAARINFPDADGTTLALVLPESAFTSGGCSYGLGTVGWSTTSSGSVYVADGTWPILAHEVGHNLSLGHANRLVCTGPNRSDGTLSSGYWSSGCTEHSYGDGQDVMGPSLPSSSALLSTPQALRVGFLPSSASRAIGGGTTTLTLNALSTGQGLRSARVSSPTNGIVYFVEYRPATGRDAANAYGHAAGIRVLRVNRTDGSTVLLDPTPSGQLDANATVTASHPFTSYDGAVRISQVSTTTTTATIRAVVKDLPKIAVVTAPKVSGTGTVGSRLSASTGSFSPTPSSYAYQWRRNGSNIRGATGSRYTLTKADAGRRISVKVTASRSRYKSTAAFSPERSIALYATKRPSIGGTPRQGRVLTAYVGAWTPKPSRYSYQWLRDGRPITGATSRYRTLNSWDVGHRLEVRITARRDGAASGKATSYRTAVVTR